MDTQSDKKRHYRFIHSLLSTTAATVFLFLLWKGFVSINNQTNALMGHGNLGMAAIIYAMLFNFSESKLHGLKK